MGELPLKIGARFVYYADAWYMQESSKVSPYITGISEYEKEYIWFRPYKTTEDLSQTLVEFLEEFT